MDLNYIRSRVHQIMLGKIAMGGCCDMLGYQNDGMGYRGAGLIDYDSSYDDDYYDGGKRRRKMYRGTCEEAQRKAAKCNPWITFLKKYKKTHKGATFKEAAAAYKKSPSRVAAENQKIVRQTKRKRRVLTKKVSALNKRK